MVSLSEKAQGLQYGQYARPVDRALHTTTAPQHRRTTARLLEEPVDPLRREAERESSFCPVS